MSNFGEYSSRGQFGASGGGQRNADSEYVRLSNCVSSNVQQLTNNVASMQKYVEKIGTSEDTPSLRDKLHSSEQRAQKLAKDTNSYLKQLMYLDGGSPTEMRQRKMQMDKLRDNFSTALNNFQQIQRRAAEKEKESVSRARAISMGQSSSPIHGYGENAALVSFDKTGAGSGQIQVQDEAEISLELIEERETAIRQLESDIVGVNEIFRDLATMVHEQGEMIDSIEANVESTAVHVEDGNVQLEKARDYQKASRRKMCCILIIVVVVAAVLAVILYVTLKNK